jgi:glycopeptide antibiotics resistance protein
MFLLNELLLHTLYLLPLFVVFRIVAFLVRRKQELKTTFWHEFGVSVLYVYLFAVLHLTVSYLLLLRSDLRLPAEYNYNLIPFAGILDILSSENARYICQNILGNIVMFIPFGVLLPLLWGSCTFARTVLAGAILSFAIEFTQFFIARGTDIDDLILNTFGTICGYGLYLILRRVTFSVKFRTHSTSMVLNHSLM